MNWLKEHLSFHRMERRGIIFLVVLIILLIGFNIYQRVFWKSDWEATALEFGPEIIQFIEKQDSIKDRTIEHKPWIPKKKSLFNFDPNTLDSTGWVKLGFSAKQTKAILKYRKMGAQFRTPEDVKKLFVVDDERYQELQSFIHIDVSKLDLRKKPRFEKPKWEKPKYEKVIVELNTADSAMLVKVKGIGPFFARVIIEHRDKLGGYRTKSQVLEVYGMDSVKYGAFADQLTVDSTLQVKINVNEADLKQLVHHPYINFNQAKAIVNYRQQHGLFVEVSDLQKIHLLKGETYRKIAPYFTVQ